MLYQNLLKKLADLRILGFKHPSQVQFFGVFTAVASSSIKSSGFQDFNYVSYLLSNRGSKHDFGYFSLSKG